MRVAALCIVFISLPPPPPATFSSSSLYHQIYATNYKCGVKGVSFWKKIGIH